MKDKIQQNLTPFVWISLCYIAAVIVTRFLDTVVILSVGGAGFITVVLSAIHNFISCGVVVTALCVVYLLLLLINRRVATVATSVFAGILILAEVSLDFFAARSGVLLGDEILLRPLGEMANTVKASVGNMMWLYLIAGIAFLILVPILVKRLSRRQMPIIVFPLIAMFMLGSILTAGRLPRVERKFDNPSVQNYITNKTIYLVRSCAFYGFNKQGVAVDLNANIATDTALLQKFIAEFPERQIEDIAYPLERKPVESENTLSPFFSVGNVAPNVVFIVVESLGREWSGPNEMGVSYTPFLDSLAGHSLYWRNCLATTKRSFGVVPALTGSVPHGPRGFQFGNMPNHNSIISILKTAGYQTNSFYASDFAFDCVMEYLLAQHTDYMSTELRQECFDRSGKQWGTYWGYHDEYLFSRSMEIIEKQPAGPKFNLYVTISAHDDLNDRNPHFDSLMTVTEQIINMMPKEKQASQRNCKARIASIVYSDFALSKLFEMYRQRPDYQNTIFVITGDHSAEIDSKNRLGFYHVPLIIYSPMLKRTADFPAVVSHLDVVPSMLAMLHNNFGIQVPETESWVGRGLDTCHQFRSNTRLLSIDYTHDIGEILYDKYFYFKEKDAVYEIDSALNFTLRDDEPLRSEIVAKLDEFKAVNNYIYLNDKLIRQPIYDRGHYVNLSMDTVAPIVCYPQPEPPSKMKAKKYPLLTNRRIALSQNTSRLRVVFSADICIEGNTNKDKQMKLFFECEGRNSQVLGEHITNFLVDEDIQEKVWYKLLISKEFDVKSESVANISVYIKTAPDDWRYTDNNVLRLRDIKISVDGK
ncbi:MAG: sulfatase-like hydrolase/transferase [Salinivirgaceae bacterium]|nr:sulfatase-like hydrolase/transferase [Salinivirgaceae bacterium]